MIEKWTMFLRRAPLFALSAPTGGEGRGEVGETPAPAHLTLPIAEATGPLPLPPLGGEGGCVAGAGA
jgi:hypothetical protein